MTKREWLAATWAEWCPYWGDGRFEVGPIVVMTRRELSRTVTAARERGRWQITHPEGGRHLHSV